MLAVRQQNKHCLFDPARSTLLTMNVTMLNRGTPMVRTGLCRLAGVLAWGIGLALAAVWPMPTAGAASGSEVAMKVMTFNLRYASTNSPNSWAVRRPVMRECLRRHQPDVMGTQEGLYHQIRDLASDLPDYEWIGTGREGGSQGEFAAIFFQKSRFEPLAYDHFWLSDTPSVIGSATWGNQVVRMATMVHFRERRSGVRFYVFNVHLDHQSQNARERSAALLRDRIARIPQPTPVLLIGDFNADPPENRAYRILVEPGDLKDLWLAAPVRIHDGLSTFHDFAGPKPGSWRIDWLMGRGAWIPRKAEVITDSRRGQYPSDHFPVMVDLILRSNVAP